MHSQCSIAVLISGRGSNLACILEAQEAYTVCSVISNKPDAAGLEFGKAAGIRCLTFPREAFPTLDAQKSALYQGIRSCTPDLVACAGFMQILRGDFVQEWQGRLVNIHPSLLPALAGLDTHQRALDQGHREHGCTVHFVDAGVDSGAVIAQARCRVEPNDTAETLAARVLSLEHLLYPWVLNQMARGQIRFDNGKATFTARCCREAHERGFLLPTIDGAKHDDREDPT